MTNLPDSIDGVSFRHFSGEEDFEGMVAMLKAQAHRYGLDRHDSVEDLTNTYRHLTNCDLDTDLVIAESDGAIVGYSRVFWWVEEATGDRVLGFIGRVHPETLQAEPTLVAWSERRLCDIAAENPHNGVQHVQTWADEPETDKVRVLVDAGFEISQTYTLMTRSLEDPIPECPLPAGLEFRPATSGDARMVWDADQEAFRDHVGFWPASEADFQQFVKRSTFDPSLWKVAFDGDRIAGQVLNFIDAAENADRGYRRGWTEWISVQRPWRKQGVAKAAIAESMRMLKDMGMTEAALGVHTTNPTGAYQLYEGLGYVVAETGHEFRKPFGS